MVLLRPAATASKRSIEDGEILNLRDFERSPSRDVLVGFRSLIRLQFVDTMPPPVVVGFRDAPLVVVRKLDEPLIRDR
jgi:hypothetical protein